MLILKSHSFRHGSPSQENCNSMDECSPWNHTQLVVSLDNFLKVIFFTRSLTTHLIFPHLKWCTTETNKTALLCRFCTHISYEKKDSVNTSCRKGLKTDRSISSKNCPQRSAKGYSDYNLHNKDPMCSTFLLCLNSMSFVLLTKNSVFLSQVSSQVAWFLGNG